MLSASDLERMVEGGLVKASAAASGPPFRDDREDCSTAMPSGGRGSFSAGGWEGRGDALVVAASEAVSGDESATMARPKAKD